MLFWGSTLKGKRLALHFSFVDRNAAVIVRAGAAIFNL